jgi:hypothetical protein
MSTQEPTETEPSNPTASAAQPPSAKRARRWRRCERVMTWVVLLVLPCATVIAAVWLGYLLGYLTGCSKSPMASTVAPLLFALLVAIGIGAGPRLALKTLKDAAAALTIAVAVIFFGFWFDEGLTRGAIARNAAFIRMDGLIGPAWSKTDAETAASIYGFRSRSRGAISHRDFEPFVVEVIKPILLDEQSDKLARVNRAIELFEARAK